MELSRAYMILGADSGDSPEMIRRKYHQMMQQYHPDTVGEDPASVFLAQQINEAYAVLKAQTSGSEDIFSKGNASHTAGQAQESAEEYLKRMRRQAGGRSFHWKAGINKEAYCERNLYEGSGTYDSGQNLWHQTSRDRYNWDPDHEDFRIFIRSVNEACSELLNAQERDFGIYTREDLPDPEAEDKVRLQLFHLLIQEFIRPAYCLRRIAEEHELDPETEGKFCFEAAVGLKGAEQMRLLDHIRPGDMLKLDAVGERIVACTRDKRELGYLSFHNDSLYYLIALLFKEDSAIVEGQVKTIHETRTSRPVKARVVLRVHVLLKEETAERSCAEINHRIEALLYAYRAYLEQLAQGQ